MNFFHKDECAGVVAFDFDNTITQDMVYQNHDPNTIAFLIGAPERLQQLQVLFHKLITSNIKIIIVTFNLEHYVKHVLKHLGLMQYVDSVFDREYLEKILILYGSDCLVRKQYQSIYRKQFFMCEYVARLYGIAGNKKMILVDDQVDNLIYMKPICQTVLVDQQPDNHTYGIRRKEIQEILIKIA